MVIVGIFYNSASSLPESAEGEYLYDAVRDLVYEIERSGNRAVLLADQESYLGVSHFLYYWSFDTSFGVKRVDETIKVDVVLKKADLKSDKSTKVINHPELYHLCRDKYLMSRMLSDLSPKTVLVSEASELNACLAKISGEIKVLKSTHGTYSQQVSIGSDNHLLKNQVKYPAILQEFIDSTYGIPGLTPSEHDLRIMMIENSPSLILLRTPAVGEHRAGLRLGANAYFPDDSQLPVSIKQLIYDVDSHFNEYPGRVYSIDCALTKDGPKIIELNKSPALWPSKENPHIDAFNKKLANHLVTFAKSDLM